MADALKVGLTYDLKSEYLKMGFTKEEVAELDAEETVEAIETEMKRQGYVPVRIGHAKALMAALVKGETYDIVFNIAEGIYGLGREALVPAILDAYRIPYTFSGPDLMALSLNKAYTNSVLEAAGIPVPKRHVIAKEADISGVKLPFPLFCKPVGEGTSKGVSEKSLVKNEKELEATCKDLLQTFNQPVLVETFLPGREFTVGLLGSGAEAKVIGVMEVKFLNGADKVAYTYENKQQYETRVKYEAVKDERVAKTALAAWRTLGCRDAGRVDLRQDSGGIPHVIELNPLAGLNPKYSDLPILCRLHGMSYQTLMEGIMKSAVKRIEK